MHDNSAQLAADMRQLSATMQELIATLKECGFRRRPKREDTPRPPAQARSGEPPMSKIMRRLEQEGGLLGLGRLQQLTGLRKAELAAALAGELPENVLIVEMRPKGGGRPGTCLALSDSPVYEARRTANTHNTKLLRSGAAEAKERERAAFRAASNADKARLFAIHVEHANAARSQVATTPVIPPVDSGH